MADDRELHSQLAAELESLKLRHSDALEHATFLGWTPEAETAHKARAKRIADITALLSERGRKPS